MDLYYEFVDYLATLPTPYLLIFAILGLLLFTLGLLLGWLIQRAKTGRYRKRANQLDREKEDLRQQLATADEEQKKLARELVNLTTEKDDSLVQQREVRKNLESITTDLRRLQAGNEQLNATNQSYATTIEDLNDQIIGLKTRNEQLLHGGTNDASLTSNPEANPGTAALEQRLRALEARMERLHPDTPEPTPSLNRARHEVRIGESFDEVKAEQRDDLTRIHTIGPFNQRKLYTAGIYTYEQIAGWSDGDLEDYAARIGYVAELMREEDWIGQARRLTEMSPDERSAEKAQKPGLQVIEGITPEIEVTLREAGVRDLPTLASTPVEELEAMLSQAGDHLALHDPGNWPQQAALAAAGDWKELARVQQAR
ncbi:hypothetical protein [Lewinella sp. IMCC34183]|uniref:hypothetical protein n=1 Tax=Lewinella sp. IMCC34183 TaxID=2248762 RepID=UPI000E2343E2|nr:hypothetical protein [Lewinella sp. IMCC34183]